MPVLPCQMQPAFPRWLGKDNCTVLVLFGQCQVCPEHHSDTLPCFYLSLNKTRGGICQIVNFCGFWRMPSAHLHAASVTLCWGCPVPLPHPSQSSSSPGAGCACSSCTRFGCRRTDLGTESRTLQEAVSG